MDSPPPGADDLDEFLTPSRRFVRASLPVVGVVVALAMVLVLGQGLIDAWLFDRAGDRVEEQLDPEDRDLAAAVLLVRTIACDGSNRTGTAFVTEVDGARVLLTNRHVVEGAATVGLRSLLGEGVPRVTAWQLAPAADVASLTVDDEERLPTPLPLATTTVDSDTPVRTVGFPSALPFTSTGTVVEASPARLRLAISTEPGASGSPVLTESGDVIGQIFARSGDGLGVATSSPALVQAVAALGEPVAGC